MKGNAPHGLAETAVLASEASIVRSRKVSYWELMGNITIMSSMPVPTPLPSSLAAARAEPASTWCSSIFSLTASFSPESSSAALPSGGVVVESSGSFVNEEGSSSFSDTKCRCVQATSSSSSGQIRTAGITTPGVSEMGDNARVGGRKADKKYSFPASPVDPSAWKILEYAVTGDF